MKGYHKPGCQPHIECYCDHPDPKDRVDHPQHYGGDTTYEAIKVINAWGLGFELGNAVKYICRAGRKDAGKRLEDLKKARWYLDWIIGRLEKEGAE